MQPPTQTQSPSTLDRPLAVTQSQGLMVSYSIQPVTVQRAGFAPVPAMYR